MNDTVRLAFPTLIDSTMRRAFTSCPTLFHREFIQHYRKGVTNVHLHAGKAYAKGLEVTRLAFYRDGLKPDEAIGLGLKALIEAYGDFECPEKSNKTCNNMMLALVEYFKQYGLQTDKMVPHISGGKHCIEFTFSLPIPGIFHPETGDPLLYGGRFDMLGNMQNVLFIVDEKTTTQLGPTWPNQWKLRSQITGYCWGALEYGYPVAGAVIRGISILSKGFGHAEVIQYRPKYMIDQWMTQLQRDAKRMIECWREGYWDMALDGACDHYGGCQFLNICTSKNPEEWLKQDFVVAPWNPMGNET